jgi:hypothetical protein
MLTYAAEREAQLAEDEFSSDSSSAANALIHESKVLVSEVLSY